MKFNRDQFLKLVATFATVLLLAACSSNTPATRLEPALSITSATESGARTYQLIGTVQLPEGATPVLEYRLNGGDWQPVTITIDRRFNVTVTLNEGSNLIEMALEVGESRVAREMTVTVAVSGAPVIAFTSGTLSQSASYRLIGVALDDF